MTEQPIHYQRLLGPRQVPVLELQRPRRQLAPIVVASPHSGRWYPADFVTSSRLDPLTLRRSEDAFVDRLFQDAPALGIPMLQALFPRSYVDVNREPWELDPDMFQGPPLPGFVNTASPRVAAGLGTLARIVAPRKEIYRARLVFSEAEYRVDTFYRPYHEALSTLVEETRARFGFCLLLDAHSMPAPAPGGLGAGPRRAADIILGDVYGASCDRQFTGGLAAFWRAQGLMVACNVPYAGGYVTRRFGRPQEGLHAVQLEVSRALYLDEATLVPLRSLATLRTQITAMLRTMLGWFEAERLVAE